MFNEIAKIMELNLFVLTTYNFFEAIIKMKVNFLYLTPITNTCVNFMTNVYFMTII